VISSMERTHLDRLAILTFVLQSTLRSYFLHGRDLGRQKPVVKGEVRLGVSVARRWLLHRLSGPSQKKQRAAGTVDRVYVRPNNPTTCACGYYYYLLVLTLLPCEFRFVSLINAILPYI
jgi:hypothetical protein